MVRMPWIVLLGVAVACAREKDKERQPPPPADPPHPARGAAATPKATDAEPTVPPPAPTVKPGGKGDCKVDYAPKPTRDPNPMCKVAGGTFMMGAAKGDRDADPNEKPAHK